MSWNAPKGGNGDGGPRENCPVGTHLAVCVALIDLGTQEARDFDDASKVFWKHQVALVWEVQGPETESGDPFYFCDKATFSANDRSKLRDWMRQAGIPDSEDDVELLLGRPFRLKIEQAESEQGKSYTRIAKKGGVRDVDELLLDRVTEPVRPPFLWKLEDARDIDLKQYAWLPYLYGKPIHEVVAACKELKSAGGGVTTAGKTAMARAGARTVGDQHAQPSDDDDTPF